MTPRTRHSVECGEVEVGDCLNDDGTDLVIAVLRQEGVFKGDYVAIIVQPKPDQIGKPKIKFHGPDHLHIHVWRKALKNCLIAPDYPPQQVHKSILAPEDNCVLCRIRPWTRRIKNDYVDGGYGYVCESCYPKTQPAGPGQPTYSLGVCSICRAEAKMAYVNALGTITSMCWKCEGDNRNNTIVFKHTHIIEKLEEPRVKVNWRGTCTCGYSCVTDESRGWVENCLAKHKHLG